MQLIEDGSLDQGSSREGSKKDLDSQDVNLQKQWELVDWIWRDQGEARVSLCRLVNGAAFHELRRDQTENSKKSYSNITLLDTKRLESLGTVL